MVADNVYPGRYSRTIAVGGFDYKNDEEFSGSYDHYPAWKYPLEDRVDIWALAERMNRAGFDLRTNSPKPNYASDPSSEAFDPSGTSYAAAQVSAVAALWVEKYYEKLEEMFTAERYKIVEAFRASLSTFGNTKVRAELPNQPSATIKILDIEAVLRKKPVDSGIAPATRAENQ